MTPQEAHTLQEAHVHSRLNLTEVLASELCGCFYCGSLFKPAKIKEWVDAGQTAVCPRCGIDAVIGDDSGVSLSPEFLAKMEEYWFGELEL